VARRKPRAEGAPDPGSLRAAGAGRFALAGEVGFDDAARLLSEGDAAFGSLPVAEIDLAQVARADSAGLALLLEWSLAAASAGRELRYRNVPPAIASLAGISDVAELLAPVSGG
jgi:phospholipid transport system transporter-binding protein